MTTYTKPVHDIERLIKSLTEESTRISKNNITLKYSTENSDHCYLLHHGHVIVIRESDNVALNAETAPFIFGLSAPSMGRLGVKMIVPEDAVVSEVPKTVALDIIRKEKLWKELSFLLQYVVHRILCHCKRVSQQNSYNVVKILLSELLNEPESLRRATSVVNYISDRSIISRSGILSILSTLREGGFIEMEKGLLNAIHRLPEKF